MGVYKKNLSLRLTLNARPSNHCRVTSSNACSRVELLGGEPDEGGAPARHIASGDVKDAFHHKHGPIWVFLEYVPLPARRLPAGEVL